MVAAQVPWKPQAIVPLLVLREPWLGPPKTEKVKLLLFTSLALRLIFTGVSSLVETVALLAVGAPLMALMITVDGALYSCPSFTTSLKTYSPRLSGVNVGLTVVAPLRFIAFAPG